MPFDDLKEFLARLKEEGALQEITAPVDPDWEVGTICREVFDRQGPAILFHRVGNHRTPLVVGALGTRRRYALALGTSDNWKEIRERWLKAQTSPIKARVVPPEKAPCKQVKKLRPQEIDLYADPFPVPRWHDKDPYPYIGTLHAVITRDPETGWHNLGTYRSALLGKDRMGCYFTWLRHGLIHWKKYQAMGKPMPVAVAFGLDPSLTMASVHATYAEVDEYDIAGGLRGEPVEVVKAELSDILVPAHAQIIVEGEIPIDDFLPQEGPFGEMHGYYGSSTNTHYIKVKAVTHQRDPVYQATCEGKPPNESTTIRTLGRAAALYHHLLSAGFPGIKDVAMPETGCTFHTVISIDKRMGYQGMVKDLLMFAFADPILFQRHCVVVDDDIDPWDLGQVEWAIATRAQSAKDYLIVPSEWTGWTGDNIGIDATHKEEGLEFRYGELIRYPQEWVKKVRARWKDYGFRE